MLLNRIYRIICTGVLLGCAPILFGQNATIMRKAHDLVNSDPDSALVLYTGILEEATDSTTVINVYTGMGNAFQFKSEYDTAVAMYFKALTMAEHKRLNLEVGSIKNNLGSVYMNIGALGDAKKSLEEALEIFVALDDTAWMTRSIINLAGVDFMTGQLEASLSKLKKSATLARLSNNLRSEGGTYSNISMVYQELGVIDSALYYVDRGIDLHEKLEDTRGLILTMESRANILLASNRVEEARETYREMEARALAMDYKFGVQKAYAKQAELEKEQQNFEEAYFLAQKAMQWKDSVISEKNISTINELNAKYETEKKDAAIVLLTKENELRESERTLLLAIGIGVTLFFVLVLYLYFQKQKTNMQLSEKNEIITEALKSNELLIKEIHHRVKNNLQIVSSLLNIQSSFLSDSQSKNAILDIQNRVLAMAMVHQNLYQGSNVTDVDSDDYLLDLLDSLKETFDDPDSPVNFKCDLDSIRIPSDYAVNIGLITNEIITNSLKHAFPPEFEREKQIELSLKKSVDNLNLKIGDNGVGLKNMNRNGDVVIADSYGWQMIQSLTKSMSGSLKVDTRGGTLVSIIFPLTYA